MHIEKFEDIEPNVFATLHTTCQKCLIRHLVEKKLEFKVDCRPVLREAFDFGKQVDSFKKMGMATEQAKWEAYRINVPAFMRDMLDLPAQEDLQDDVWVCTARHKVGRASRRMGKTVAVRGLAIHRSCFSSTTVLVVAPYESQIHEFFASPDGGLDAMLARSAPEIQDLVIPGPAGRRYVAKPTFKMRFVTGAHIIGRVLHSSNEARGSSVRGTGVVGLRNVEEDPDSAEVAGMLIIDESDYLGQKDYQTINPIKRQNPNIDVIEISTPSGKREEFYKHCTSPDYREFYCNIWDRRDIRALVAEGKRKEANDIVEAVRRDCINDDEFDREYMANFGQPSFAVFHPDDLHAISQTSWAYSEPVIDIAICLPKDPPPKSEIIRNIGVDWNTPQYGMRLWVCDYFVKEQIYRYVDKWVVGSGNFAQLMALDSVRCANRIFRPEFIYVDAGYGTTQVEKLHQIGMQSPPGHPDSLLADIVIPIDMQTRIRVPDPASQDEDEWRQLTSKALMISFLQSMTQERAIFFNKLETGPGGIIPAMREFKVERRGASGHPIYTGKDDHDIIAAALALFAFYKNYHLEANMMLPTMSMETITSINGQPAVHRLMPKALYNDKELPTIEDDGGLGLFESHARYKSGEAQLNDDEILLRDMGGAGRQLGGFAGRSTKFTGRKIS